MTPDSQLFRKKSFKKALGQRACKMSKRSKTVAAAPKQVPIQRTDLSTFDDSLAFLKEKFTAEMRRMDDEMNKFSVNLLTLYGQNQSTPPPGQTSGVHTWDSLAKSPLIEGEGTEKTLKLQFDVNGFEAGDIKVEILDDRLIVYAHHQHKTDNLEDTRELRREFLLPRGTDHATVISSLSRDGVLTIQVPLPQIALTPPESKPGKEKNVLSKNPQATKPGKRGKGSVDQIAADDKAAALALAGRVPQSPMSSVSPASPNLNLASATESQGVTPQDASNTGSK